MFSRILVAVFVIAFSMAMIFMYTDAAEAQFAEDGLICYLSFDEVDCQTVIDSMGNHDGAIVGGLEQTDEGKVDKAFLFLRAENEPCITVDEPGAFSAVDDFTWATWIKSTATGGSFMAMTGGNDVPDEKTWQVTGTLSVEVAWAGVVLTGSEQVADDAWHYVAMVYEVGTLTFYVDGKEDAVGAVTYAGDAAV
ncbi:LamG-like jellyroll fold domain-containing protein [Candidatus Poribacteria bacterium]